MSTAETTKKHHHGDLRRALIDSGIEILEEGTPFSLRAVARRVGVSQTAPYRHFRDKMHLEAAMAAEGFRDLRERLESVVAESGESATPLEELAVVYVRRAVDCPALYGLMFAQPCGEDDERLHASASVFDVLERVAHAGYPDRDSHALANAGWALAHGLVSLHLAGKYGDVSQRGLESRVRESFAAILGAEASPDTPVTP